MASKYYFSLNAIKPQKSYPSGNLTRVTSKEVPGFVNISFSSLKLSKRGSLEPIWYPNSNKIGYCLGGKGLVTMRTPGSIEVFTIEKGEIFFVPQGFVHNIENINDSELHIVFAFNHVDPEIMHLSKAFNSLSDDVFTATFNTPASFLKELKPKDNQDLLKTLPARKVTPGFISSRFKFNIEDSSKTILNKGGYLQLTTKTNLPVLDGLGILGFGLNPKGVVEPHWHTNAGELVYIVKGETRITVLSPDGSLDVVEVNGGEGAFAPASYFHNIENIGKDNVEVIAFFSHAEPDYVGIGEVMGTFDNDVLGSIFNVPASTFDTLKKPSGPLVIVPS